MAKVIARNVAQRIIVKPQKLRFTSCHVRLSTQSNQIKNQGRPYTNLSLPTLYPNETIETLVDKLNEAEDVKNELLTQNTHDVRLNNYALDTHALVKILMEKGFTLSQAEALTMVMVTVVNQNVDNLHSSMVSKPQAELTLQKIAGQLAILRRDMMIMEKTDFTELVTKSDRLAYELSQLQNKVKDEISKVSSTLTLDLNLEKGKVKDMHADHLNLVEQKHGRIIQNINNLEKELQTLRSYINTENAALQTTFERYKSDTIKFAFGSVATCMTIILGFYRLWM